MAELLAIVRALDILGPFLEDNQHNVVHIFTDSKYALLCIGSYGKKHAKSGWSQSFANKECVRSLYTRCQEYGQRLIFTHIRAHTKLTDVDSQGNAAADKLANEAACQ